MWRFIPENILIRWLFKKLFPGEDRFVLITRHEFGKKWVILRPEKDVLDVPRKTNTGSNE